MSLPLPYRQSTLWTFLFFCELPSVARGVITGPDVIFLIAGTPQMGTRSTWSTWSTNVTGRDGDGSLPATEEGEMNQGPARNVPIDQ